MGSREGPLGPLGSFNSHHRRTLELILQDDSAFFQASHEAQAIGGIGAIEANIDFRKFAPKDTLKV
jgi:hypothetical protein